MKSVLFNFGPAVLHVYIVYNGNDCHVHLLTLLQFSQNIYRQDENIVNQGQAVLGRWGESPGEREGEGEGENLNYFKLHF